MASSRFPAIDFDAYHRATLPALLADGRAADVAHATRGRRSLALRLREGGAYTYLPRPDGLEIVPGDERAQIVVELDAEAWQGLVHELEAPAGLLYGGRLRCLRGHAMQMMAWEPGLRALYNGRPLYDPERLDLRDRRGEPLDPERTFTLADDRAEMAHFLRTAGYLFVRGVFDAREVRAFLDDAERLRQQARKGDRLSWWGENAAAEEVLCRVTRGASQPNLATLPADPRLRELVDLLGESLCHRSGEGDGVTVIWKHPDMVEGLANLPWHRDCGMGGHAIQCPTWVVSSFLTPATPETGDLRMLPGSHLASFGSLDAADAAAPRGVRFAAEPGDVSLHCSDTMHAAPAPSGRGPRSYRISAVVGFGRPGAYNHRGEDSYNAVLHGRDDGQIEHLERVADRA